jgi:hypothetical protein
MASSAHALLFLIQPVKVKVNVSPCLIKHRAMNTWGNGDIALPFSTWAQNNSQCCINKRAWTSANNIWITMVTTESSLVTKHRSIIASRRVNGQQEKVQKPTIRMKNDAYRFLGLNKAQYWTLSAEGHNNKQCFLLTEQGLPRNTVERCVVS